MLKHKAFNRAAAGTLALASAAANATLVTIEFDELAAHNAGSISTRVNEAYNGGTTNTGVSSTNYGVSFTSGARTLCLNTTGVTCSGSSAADDTNLLALSWAAGSSAFVNVAAGFDEAVSIDYMQGPNDFNGLRVYDGLNGTGNLLAEIIKFDDSNSGIGDPDCVGLATSPFRCKFSTATLAFSGVGKSLVFTTRTGGWAPFDNITFEDVGLTHEGGEPGAVPTPGTIALLGAAYAASVANRRRRKDTAPALAA